MPDPTMTEKELSMMFQEVNLCEKIIDADLIPKVTEALARYTGRWVPPHSDDWNLLINEAYPNVQINLNSTFFQNPRMFAKPKNKNFIVKVFDPELGVKKPVVMDSARSAKIQESLHNWLNGEIGYKDELRRIALDSHMFPYGVSWKGYLSDFGIGDDGTIDLKNEQIFYRRLRPDWFLWDPAAVTLKDCRWVGRKFEMPLDDIKDDDRFKLEDNIDGTLGFNRIITDPRKVAGDFLSNPSGVAREDPLNHFSSQEYRKSSRSKFIVLYELWIRPTRKERSESKNAKGRVVVMIREQKKPLDIRNWPYSGMEGWPVNLLAFSQLNDTFVGISELLTYGDQMDEKTAIRNYQLQNAKKVSNQRVGVDKNKVSPEDLELWRDPDNNYLKVDGKPSDILQNLPVGSISAEFYLADQKIQQDLDRVSGIADIQRGIKTPGEETATAVRQRVGGTAIRPKAKAETLREFIIRDQRQFNQLIKQFFTIPDVIQITGELEPEFIENLTKEEIQAEVELTFDVVSMLAPSPEVEVNQLTDFLNVLAGAASFPEFQKELARSKKIINILPIIEQIQSRLNITNPEVIRNVRPEESKGFVSVVELEAAQQNVIAIIQGAQRLEDLPSPPAEGQDHEVRLRVYRSLFEMLSLLAPGNPLIEALQQLAKAQEEVQKEEARKNAPSTGQAAPEASKTNTAVRPQQLAQKAPSFDKILAGASR